MLILVFSVGLDVEADFGADCLDAGFLVTPDVWRQHEGVEHRSGVSDQQDHLQAPEETLLGRV